MTKPKPVSPEAIDPYALPTITLEEAKAEPSRLTGTHTISYYLSEDCSDLAVVSHTVAAKSYTIKSREPLDDDPLENLLCFAQPDNEECSEVNVFLSYMTEDGFQVFETDGRQNRQYTFWPYGECRPTQVFGEGVYTKVFRDGEVITDNELLESSHAYYDIPDASLAEVQADLSLLSGLTTNSMYATPDCSGPVIATHTHPGEGDQLYTREPLLDDTKLNIYCLIDQTAKGCVKTSGFFQRYISDDGVQIIVDDDSIEYEMAAYGACIPSQVYGNASFKIHAGGHPIVEKE